MDDLRPSDPEKIDDFVLLKRIGAGGFGVVYLAVDPSGGQLALKVLRPEFSDDPRFRERLLREARSLAAVSGERTARVIRAGATDDYAFLAMEYVPGESLDRLIEGEYRPEGPMLWFIALGLVEAIQEIHSAGVVHRDLKPSNVIVGPDGLKVVDFGISAIIDDGKFTQTGTMMGTATWLSPEQILGEPVDERTDIFGLGMLLAYIGLGRHPYGEGRPDAVMYRIANTRPDLSELSNPYRLAVSRCLARDPKERPTLSSLLSFFETGGSVSSETALGVVKPKDSTMVVQPSDMTSASRQSSPNREAINDGSRSERSRGRKRLALVGLAAAVILGGVIGLDATNTVDLGVVGSPKRQVAAVTAPESSESTPTTVRIAPTTSTTTPPPPAFKLAEFEGFNIRWNPCDIPISILLNTTGKLTAQQEASLARYLSAVAVEITEMTGLPVLYSGTTDRKISTRYKVNEEILIQIDQPGNGILGEEYGDSPGTSQVWLDRIQAGFREIDSFDIHLNSVGFVSEYFTFGVQSELNPYGKRLIKHFLGAALGLDALDDSAMVGFGFDEPSQRFKEVMYWGNQSWPLYLPKWGPGDQLAMTLVGASNGCF